MVSSSGAITVLAAPSVTAPNAAKNALISGVQRGQESRSHKPSFAPAHRMKTSCVTPPASTPQAAAYAALGNHCHSSNVAIMERLSRLDQAAPAQKRSMAFSIADSCTATSVRIR